MSNSNFIIMTEVTCDLPTEYLSKNNIATMPLIYSLDDIEYDGTVENSLGPHEFYEQLKTGKKTKTTQNSPQKVSSFFKKELEKGKDILYIGFSSALSGSFQSALIAMNDLKVRYPKRTILAVDSLSASLGQGLLVDYAVKLSELGMSLEDVCAACDAQKLNVCHYFTVDDLNHLYRGGRVSKASAVIGSFLGIKPVMHVNNDGKLIPIGKVRGRRQSLEALVEKMGTKLKDTHNEYVMISHGDCLEDANYVSQLVNKRFGLKTEIINFIGPVIGSHSGPGTVALFFFGESRDEKPM